MEETNWFKALLLTQHWVLFHSRSFLPLMINYPDLRNCFRRTLFHRDRQNFVQKLVFLGGWALGKKHVWSMLLTRNKVWQAISCFGHTCFAANTSIDRLDVLRKGPRLTVTSGVTIIMTDYRSSWPHGQPPAKRRKAKIWLTIARSVNNFIRSELPASKSDMAPKDIGKRRKMWQKWGTILYNSTHPLISWRKSLAKL